MSTERDWNAEVIAEFRANQGIVDGPIENPPPMLLVHTTGARTGQERITPMRCRPEGDSWYIFGSAHGSDRHPGWYYNLVANPEIEIEIGLACLVLRRIHLPDRGVDADCLHVVDPWREDADEDLVGHQDLRRQPLAPAVG